NRGRGASYRPVAADRGSSHGQRFFATSRPRPLLGSRDARTSRLISALSTRVIATLATSRADRVTPGAMKRLCYATVVICVGCAVDLAPPQPARPDRDPIPDHAAAQAPAPAGGSWAPLANAPAFPASLALL